MAVLLQRGRQRGDPVAAGGLRCAGLCGAPLLRAGRPGAVGAVSALRVERPERLGAERLLDRAELRDVAAVSPRPRRRLLPARLAVAGELGRVPAGALRRARRLCRPGVVEVGRKRRPRLWGVSGVVSYSRLSDGRSFLSYSLRRQYRIVGRFPAAALVGGVESHRPGVVEAGKQFVGRVSAGVDHAGFQPCRPGVVEAGQQFMGCFPIGVDRAGFRDRRSGLVGWRQQFEGHIPSAVAETGIERGRSGLVGIGGGKGCCGISALPVRSIGTGRTAARCRGGFSR